MLCLGTNFFACLVFAVLAFKSGTQYSLSGIFAIVAGLNSAYSFTTMELITGSQRVFRAVSFFRQGVIFFNSLCIALVGIMFAGKLFILEHGEGRWAAFMCTPYIIALLLALRVKLRYDDPYGIELARAALFSPRGQAIDKNDVAARARGRQDMATAEFYKNAATKCTRYGLLLLFFGAFAAYKSFREFSSVWTLSLPVLGVAGISLICIGQLVSRKGLKLGKIGVLEFFGKTAEEISDIEKNATAGDTQDMRLQAIFLDYRNEHAAQINGMEELFDRLMTKNYGFTAQFAKSLRVRNIGKYPVSEAVFWHREYKTVEQVAQGFYQKYSTSLGLNDPSIFSVDIKNGRSVERSKEATIWVWLLDGNVTTKRKIFAIILAIFLLFLIYLKLRLHRLVP